MNQGRLTRRTRCAICLYLTSRQELTDENLCEKYLLEFLTNLQENLDDEEKIEGQFINSMFDDEDQINQPSCTGSTLMHVNILGGQNESEQENGAFNPPYEEAVALRICQILLKRGASPNGNTLYEMRPLHIAIRREWRGVGRLLLEAGANANIPEKDIYASRPMDIAVLNDDAETVELLHLFGASLNGIKSMFHLPPLAEAFVRGYFDVYKTLLELGVQPRLELERGMFRSFGTQLFQLGPKGRQHFIQLLHDHGGDIESQFRVHAIRVEADGVLHHQSFLRFSCDAICIADLDPSIFIKWMSECRSLKSLCRLNLRRYLFATFPNGFQRLCSFKSQTSMNPALINYLLFNKQT